MVFDACEFSLRDDRQEMSDLEVGEPAHKPPGVAKANCGGIID
jgi:hypothetical protein